MNELETLKSVKGVIFNIQHFCIHDGPGIRTTVFFKGCPLSCMWCHNPEGIAKGRHLSFTESKCALCGECAKVCPGAHAFAGGKHELLRERCPDALFDDSAAACVTKALAVVGYEISAGEVIARVLRDRPFYADGGGVTFSGGEPAMQKGFLSALLALAKGEGIHTALETCALCDYAYLESVIPYVDLFLIDYKETDPEKHRQFTGAGNALILENIGKLHGAGARILLRCPIIPDVNDRDDHFEGIAAMTAGYPGLLGAEILPYHKLAASKAGRMGLDAARDFAQPSAEQAESWRARARSFGARIVET